jgi:hypothetical protein
MQSLEVLVDMELTRLVKNFGKPEALDGSRTMDEIVEEELRTGRY